METLTRWPLDVFLICIPIIAYLIIVVHSNVCVMKKRPNPSRGGVLRSSLLLADICLCKVVITPEFLSHCPRREIYAEGELWFTDDPQESTMRQNWNKDILYEILERRYYCADECKDGTDNCDVNEFCIKNLGSYTFHCSQGYSGDGLTCTDIDECADDTHTCASHADCENTDGNYTCQCRRGYSGDGSTCTGPCNETLGVEDGRISDNQLTASSEFSAPANYFGVTNARLNRPAQSSTTGAWSPLVNDINQWIQAAIGYQTWVTGVLLQGRQDATQWVTKFKVQYSEDGLTWNYVQQLATHDAEVFTGNDDQNTVVTSQFSSPVRASFIRIRPTE